MLNKIYNDSAALSKRVQQLKKNGLTIGCAPGCFDHLHNGHRHLLKEAASQCDFLIVYTPPDKIIRHKKGPIRPHEKSETRAQKLTSLDFVQAVFADTGFDGTYDEFNAHEKQLVQSINPDILFAGYDYKDILEHVAENLGLQTSQVKCIPTGDFARTSDMIAGDELEAPHTRL